MGMDRKGQLRNVAFGGAWSEQIAGNETLADAMARVEAAVRDTLDEDLRADAALAEAVTIVCAAHPKGGLLADAWRRALGQGLPGVRAAELGRIAATMRAGLGGRLGK